MTLTAMAVVVFVGPGQPWAGAIAHLETVDGTQLLVDISNHDGYMVFNNVPIPFVGKLKMGGSVQYYEQDVNIQAEGVSLRVGPQNANPQDIMLPAAVPFV